MLDYSSSSYDCNIIVGIGIINIIVIHMNIIANFIILIITFLFISRHFL